MKCSSPALRDEPALTDIPASWILDSWMNGLAALPETGGRSRAGFQPAGENGFQPRLFCSWIRSSSGRMPNKPAGKMPALLYPRHCKPLQTISNRCKGFSGKKIYLNSADATQPCHLGCRVLCVRGRVPFRGSKSNITPV